MWVNTVRLMGEHLIAIYKERKAYNGEDLKLNYRVINQPIREDKT